MILVINPVYFGTELLFKITNGFLTVLVPCREPSPTVHSQLVDSILRFNMDRAVRGDSPSLSSKRGPPFCVLSKPVGALFTR